MISATTASTGTTGATPSASSTSATDATASQDRFLKLLVAQLNNQDPMNPMDNAQMTSQMAQINTVTGIEKLNQTMTNMAQQFSSAQVLQGASLVGRSVLTDGNTLTLDGQQGTGGMDLSGSADAVNVAIVGAGGQLIDTINLGPQAAGRVMFDWTAPSNLDTANLTFQITATQGATKVTAAPLSQNKVVSVGLDNGTMSLMLQGQQAIAYSSVRAIL